MDPAGKPKTPAAEEEMTPAQLRTKLDDLRVLPNETPWVEFKGSVRESKLIGEYLSALSNAAALAGEPTGYMAWGVEDKTHRIIGTKFKPFEQKGAGSEDLVPWLTKLLSPRVRFQFHEFEAEGKPVVLLELQAANTAPVAFSGRRWVRVDSHKKPLNEHLELERRLWDLVSGPPADWSRGVCPGATLDDLDSGAVALARDKYREKVAADPSKAHLVKELFGWDDRTFLNKARVCAGGKVTRTALLLLGKPEEAHHLAPAIPQVFWILKDAGGATQDYRKFEPPLLPAVDGLFGLVRNLTVRHLPDGTLFPNNVSQYDPWVLREILHNGIAHQDYTDPAGGRINVVEQPDRLVFSNRGRFLPGSVEEAISRDVPQERTTNPFLAQAMFSLNMIDTIGSGIRVSFVKQRERFFPMPTYDLSEPGRVQVRLPGTILDRNYTRMLMSVTNLPLPDVIALDKVQKGAELGEDEYQSLKEKNLVEGRRPKLRVSADVAKATDTMADYLSRRGIDIEYAERMILELLEQQSGATRAQIDGLLLEKLSDALGDQQKRAFVKNRLQALRGRKRIVSRGKGPKSRWELADDRGQGDG